MADSREFELKIIEPDGVFYDGACSFLEFTSTEGRMGVYKEHIPMTVILVPAVMKIHLGEEVKRAEISGGFVEIQKERITVLAEGANWEE
ncbi:MAG: F0F1 ATP synthase subunit epsilon [Faecalimonas sp.]|nr:F0F1 ATP synthase subunit epsilon [Faecalimonas sp.]